MWFTMAWSLDVVAGVSTSGWRGAGAPVPRHPDQFSDHAGGENGEGGNPQIGHSDSRAVPPDRPARTNTLLQRATHKKTADVPPQALVWPKSPDSLLTSFGRLSAP